MVRVPRYVNRKMAQHKDTQHHDLNDQFQQIYVLGDHIFIEGHLRKIHSGQKLPLIDRIVYSFYILGRIMYSI